MFKTYRRQRRGRVDAAAVWVQATFSRRQCCKFVPSVKDNSRCVCGALWQCHSDGSPATLQQTAGRGGRTGWSPASHTTLLPTNAFGTLAFQGSGLHPVKCHYVRVSYDTPADQLQQLLVSAWRLQLPKLVVSVYGGRANFELPQQLRRSLRRGLLRVAKTTGAWLVTGGTNTGVSRCVGDALTSGHIQSGHSTVCIGVAPWGAVEGSQGQLLLGMNREVPYCSGRRHTSQLVPLNGRHTHVILADDGTVGQYGGEYRLRRCLERHLARNPVILGVGGGTPLVCVLVEGGADSVTTVLDLVTDSPPVPVVVCAGTGRAADIIAFAHRHTGSQSGQQLLATKCVRHQLLATIERSLELSRSQALRLLDTVLLCCQHRHMITVYSEQSGGVDVGGGGGGGGVDNCREEDVQHEHRHQHHQQQQQAEQQPEQLDETILRVLLEGQRMSPADQLSLALSWNRVDLARSTVFCGDDTGCSMDVLEQSMMDALVLDRTDFVQLLLDHGVLMTSFLTVDRLDRLYNSGQTTAAHQHSLRHILADVRHKRPKRAAHTSPSGGGGGRFTIIDVGLMLNHLMGGAYRSSYSRRRFRTLYAQNQRHRLHKQQQQQQQQQQLHNLSQQQLPPSPAAAADGTAVSLDVTEHTFRYPYSELLIWAVLTGRQHMALLMWQKGEEALAKALVACKLYKALAREAAEDNLATEFYQELKSHAEQFETLALELVTVAAARSAEFAQQLLTYQLSNWSGHTCLALAVAADLQRVLALPCCQTLLANLWMGGLRVRRNSNLKVVLSLLCPPLLFSLEFRTREELKQMPQTEREYLLEQQNDGDEGASYDGADCNDDYDDDDDEREEEGRDRPVVVCCDDTDGHTVNGHALDMDCSVPSKRHSSVLRQRVSSGGGEHPPSTHHAHQLTPSPPPPPPPNHNTFNTVADTAPYSSIIMDHFTNTNTTTTTTDIYAAQYVVNNGFEHVLPSVGNLSNYQPPAVRSSQLSYTKKIHEFYTAPITKFWSFTLSYVVFLCLLTYLVLVRMDGVANWAEVFVTVYIACLALDKVRDIILSEPYTLRQKLGFYLARYWNLCDVVFIGAYLLLQPLRFRDWSFRWARVGICCNAVYWYLRLFEIFSVDKYLGPLVHIIGRMLVKMMHFIVLLAIILFAFGVLRQSIRRPREQPSWYLLRHVFYQPYFMLYGEVFAPEIEPEECGDGADQDACELWITVVAMTVFLLVANILLLNLLVAVFNHVFSGLNTIARQLWMFQRYQLVIGYEARCVCPPPLALPVHLTAVTRYICGHVLAATASGTAGLVRCTTTVAATIGV